MKLLSKKSVIIIVVAVIVALAIITVAVVDAIIQKRNTPHTHTGIAMGSAVSQKIYGDDICAEISQAVATLDSEKISTTSLSSDISKINENAGKSAVTVSAETAEYIRACIDIANKTNGAFNPLMGALIDLWNIESESPQVPSEQDIEKALLLCDYTKIQLDGNSVYLPQEGMKLHLGAAGKGIACDTAYKIIKGSDSVRGAVVSVGGSVMTYGKNPEANHWTIGVRDPKAAVNDVLGVLKLEGENYISTSGSYEKYFEQDGVRYHHILDYSTGAPAQRELLGVTVVAPSGILSDALSTACFVLDTEQAIKILSDYGCQAIFVYKNGDIIITDGLAECFELKSNSYRIAQVGEV